ncbi:MAG TPA: flavin reductase family protein [Mycobacteriales bacterium]|nr:flavin reductase family protein [Mycobacteriales bacterium]
MSSDRAVLPWVDDQTYRDAMSLLAAPTTVVTGLDRNGRRWGFTASSVTSVSLDPPLVLVGVDRTSSCHRAMLSAHEFVVNVLAGRHGELARRFATHGADRFAGGEFDIWPGSALPCLPDANALVRCATFQIIPVGDHDLVVGAVVEARVCGSDPPLVWYRRSFL